MKTIITSLFLFCAISLFAQPQKGDIYVGFSNLNFVNSHRVDDFGFSEFSQSSLSISPTFGKFITNNTLIGGGFSFFTGFSSPTSSVTSTSSFGLNFLSAQYFGKGKFKGLGQFTLNSNLTRNDFADTGRSLTSNLGLGGAYFVNKFTSLQLLYSINLFSANERLGTEYFVRGVAPNIALTLRLFLLRNREGIENLSALNSIKKGTRNLSVSARLSDFDSSYSHSFGGAFNYFFTDNLYGNVGLASSLSKGEQFISRFSSLDFSISTGYYLRVTDRFYGKFALGMKNESRFSKFLFDGVENINSDMNAVRWNMDLGVAFFLGRHKLEPGIGVRISNTRLNQLGPERLRDVSSRMFINYEWFLAENFAFSANTNIQINNISYFILNNTIALPVENVFEFSRNDTNLNIGFKWYLSTPTE